MRQIIQQYKLVGLIILIGLIGLSALLLSPKREGEVKQAQDTTPITIGALYSLTGAVSDIGEAMRRGSEIAVDEINSAGGINGAPIKVVYEDASYESPHLSTTAAQKLMSVDKVKVLLDMPYSVLGSMQSIAESQEVPVICTIDSSDEIASFGDWIFGSGIYADGVGREVAQYALQDLNVTKSGVIVGKEEYLLAVTGGFEKAFTELGGEVVAREEFLVGDHDFRAQIAKAMAAGAEALFVGHLGEGGLVVKQATELGFNGYFLGSDTFSMGEVHETAGAALNDKTFFALWRNFDQITPEQEEFVQTYRAKYGDEPGDYLFYNVLGYDGVMVAVEAIRNSDGSSQGIKEALYQIDGHSGLSGSISIDETGINRDPKSAIVTYVDGEIVRAELK